jgi:thioesterase domain-containing protein
LQADPSIELGSKFGLIAKKAFHFLAYEVGLVTQSIARKIAYKSLRLGLKQGQLENWPFATPNVDTMLRMAEAKYQAASDRGPIYDGQICLFKALRRRDDLREVSSIADVEINDTPYLNYFDPEALGWNFAVNEGQLEVVEVDAGHSTLLIDKYLSPVVEKLTKETNGS